MWCAICASELRSVQVGCDLCRWGAICACGVPHCSQMPASRPKEIINSVRFCETKLSGCRGGVKTESNFMNTRSTDGLQGYLIMCSVRVCGNNLSGCRRGVKTERTDKNTLRTDYKVNSQFFGVRLRKRLSGCRGGR
jgi:hypothetical protein